MYKILIIEDDQIIAKALKNHLDKWELETQIVEDFHHILDQFVGVFQVLCICEN
ncbi:hypothetical protein [Acetobacterium malicum]|uniref:hypothetical protein n=1 Tax=Acetobacterium malicum TaxID=52692 RepID=UPI00040B85B8|nr:hypothetical protein [Acetobacterium dehalogenans]